MFSNLAANAAKHTKRDRITITAQTQDSERVLIELADTGSSISPEAQPRIFDRFYPRRDTGAGRLTGSASRSPDRQSTP